MLKWSPCSPSTPSIQVRIPLKSTVIFMKIVEREQKYRQRGRESSILIGILTNRKNSKVRTREAEKNQIVLNPLDSERGGSVCKREREDVKI